MAGFRPLALAPALGLGIAAPPVQAEWRYPNYLVDILVAACMADQKPGGHAVYAYSSIDFGFCIHGDVPLAQQRKTAVERCNKSLPDALRGQVQCKVLAEDGKIVNRALLADRRRDIRQPVTIEVMDGASGTVATERGYLSSGRYIRANTREIKLADEGGKALCRGEMRESASGFSYEMDCGNFVFTGRNPTEHGSMFYDGNWVGIFDVKFRYKTSWMRLQTIVPKGAKVIC